MITLVATFLLVWIFSFFFHEVCHYSTAKLLGGKPKISVWFYKDIIPSMRCLYSNNLQDKWVVDFAGGGFTGLIMLIFATSLFGILNCRFFISLFIIGFLQIVYGLFEMAYINRLDRDAYMKYHYGLYAIMIVVGIGLLWNEIWSCV